MNTVHFHLSEIWSRQLFESGREWMTWDSADLETPSLGRRCRNSDTPPQKKTVLQESDHLLDFITLYRILPFPLRWFPQWQTSHWTLFSFTGTTVECWLSLLLLNLTSIWCNFPFYYINFCQTLIFIRWSCYEMHIRTKKSVMIWFVCCRGPVITLENYEKSQIKFNDNLFCIHEKHLKNDSYVDTWRYG